MRMFFLFTRKLPGTQYSSTRLIMYLLRYFFFCAAIFSLFLSLYIFSCANTFSLFSSLHFFFRAAIFSLFSSLCFFPCSAIFSLFFSLYSFRAESAATDSGNLPPNRSLYLSSGTSRIALRLAEQVHKRYKDVDIYIAEPDKEMAEMASEYLPESVRVLVGSSTDRHFLREEGIRYDDLFVAATDREDLNVLSCLLAKKEGAKRTVALVYQTELEYVVQDTGIDTLINPKRVTVNAIVNRATSTDEIEGMETVIIIL